MLGGRYRLEDLLSEHEGARFWRATDTVLARSVAVHALASTDARAPGVLDAARRSARVTDPHFLRVLDCDDVDGLTWVVNEWGEGASLDLMLERGTLPPTRAAWLAREVAEAIAAAHAQDLHHGRLNPEAVLVTDSGSVKVIGFIVNAAFEGPAAVHPAYGPIGPREADVIDVAGILYAALTGRWPGVAPSSVPRAPRDGRRPLRPRQVRAGVPRTLDAICDRVLAKEAAQHSLPIETAHEIAAALSDYVGDPAAAAPVDVPSMYDEPEPATPEPPDDQAALPPWTAGAGPAPATGAPPSADEDADGNADENEDKDADSPDVVEDGSADPEATMAAMWAAEFDEPEPWEAPAPPPPLETMPERPLFADHERRLPPGAPPPPPPAPAQQSAADVFDSSSPTGTSDTSARYWPFEDADDTGGFSGKEGRSWLKLAAVVALAIAVMGAMFVAFDVGRGNDQKPAAPATTSPSTAPVTGSPVRVVRAVDFDPESDGSENHGEVGRAIDGDPRTSWRTLTYRGNAQLGGLKSGVGLVLDLGADHAVSSVELTLVGAPTDLELYATAPGVNDPPAELADTRRLAGMTADSTSAIIRLSPKVTTRYLVVWLTKLPPVPGGFRGEIAEVAVHS
jgi:hypothetical protein